MVRRDRIVEIKAHGGSMRPLISQDAMCKLDSTSRQIYRAGDIVAYIGYGGTVVIHRIIYTKSTSSGRHYLLKGDHNSGLDRYVDENRLIGKVQKVIYPSFSIDLTTSWASFIAWLIARCERTTTGHRWFYAVERIAVFCLTTGLMLSAQLIRPQRGTS